jgi:hypothetical protein
MEVLFTAKSIKDLLITNGYQVTDITEIDETIEGLSFHARINGYILSIQCRWDSRTKELKSYGITDKNGLYECVEMAIWNESKGFHSGLLTPDELDYTAHNEVLDYQSYSQILRAINCVKCLPRNLSAQTSV